MARRLNTRIALAGLSAVLLFACNSCIYIEAGDTGWHGRGDMVRHEREVPLAAPLTAGSSFSAETGDGSITVRGLETSDCTVVAKIVAHAKTVERAQELAEEVNVRLEPSASGLKIVIDGPHRLSNAWYAVSLEVQVPTQTDLILSTGDGSVHVKDIVGAVDAQTSDGSIEAQAIKGNTKLRTSDGGITATQIEAETVEAHTGDGGITLTNVRADNLTARSGDGSIQCRGLAVSRVECHTSDGSIHLDCAPDGPKAPNVTVTTSDGGITFTAPLDLSAVLDASTGDGSIHSSLPLTNGRHNGKSLTGTVGDGEGRIHLRTHDGSITIR
jgi:DUF4097 and DUF4098 domain-containing protein YvlB